MRFCWITLVALVISGCASSSGPSYKKSIQANLAGNVVQVVVLDKSRVIQARLKNGEKILIQSTQIQYQQFVEQSHPAFSPSIGFGVGAFTGGNVQFGGGVGVDVPLTSHKNNLWIESSVAISIPNMANYRQSWSSWSVEVVLENPSSPEEPIMIQIPAPQPQ